MLGWQGNEARTETTTVKGVSVHVEALVPIRVQRLLDDSSRLGLFSVDGCDGERVGKSYMGVMSFGVVIFREKSTTTYGRHLACRDHLLQ